MDTTVATYLGSVTRTLAESLGGQITAAWAVGSLATGDFDARRSDMDVIAVCDDDLGDEAKTHLRRVLSHGLLPCPAYGLDLIIYCVSDLHQLPREPHYQFSIATGAAWDDEVGTGGPYSGGIVDLALAREVAITVEGVGPRQVIPDVPRSWVLDELRKGVEWHHTKIHDPFHDPTGTNAVLNACRALYFASRGAFVSKSIGAHWWLEAHETPVVAEALSQREGVTSVRPLDAASVRDFLEAAADTLTFERLMKPRGHS